MLNNFIKCYRLSYESVLSYYYPILILLIASIKRF